MSEMTDLELTKACAAAMGHEVLPIQATTHKPCAVIIDYKGLKAEYSPLYYDDQAMKLVKKFRLKLEPGYVVTFRWLVVSDSPYAAVMDADLNRAVCECIARLHPPGGGG